ncbi:MAG: hypothetical protein SFT93_01450 [Rickettsiaceae bacterium]|nr:hypothetical protein [Rickettsiaceae bacterium]
MVLVVEVSAILSFLRRVYSIDLFGKLAPDGQVAGTGGAQNRSIHEVREDSAILARAAQLPLGVESFEEVY